MKYTYFVGMIDKENKLHFVTKIDNKSRVWYATKGEHAKHFTKTHADDMMYAMRCNGTNAVVIKAPDFAEYMNEEA